MAPSPRFAQRNVRGIYFVAGLLLGIFLGYTVLHSFRTDDPLLTVEQLESGRAELSRLEARAEAALSAVSNIAHAEVTLSPALHPTRWHYVEATIVLNLTGDSLSTDQLEGIAGLVAGAVEGLDDGHVVLLDETGLPLNTHLIQQVERKQFWTGVALNVAKILGILAALISVRAILGCVMRDDEEEDKPSKGVLPEERDR